MPLIVLVLLRLLFLSAGFVLLTFLFTSQKHGSRSTLLNTPEKVEGVTSFPSADLRSDPVDVVFFGLPKWYVGRTISTVNIQPKTKYKTIGHLNLGLLFVPLGENLTATHPTSHESIVPGAWSNSGNQRKHIQSVFV